MNPSIDILGVVQDTYRLLWRERFYLLRLALIPATLIYLNMVIVMLVIDDLSALRHGLALMPAMIAESWVVCQFLRTVMTSEYWPISVPKEMGTTIPPFLLARARALLSAMVFYVLILVLLTAAKGVMIETFPLEVLKNPPHFPLTDAQKTWSLSIFATLLVILLNFRLLWLHLPLVVGVSIGRFWSMTRSPRLNIQMIGVWIAAMIPAIGAWFFFIAPLAPLTHGEGVGAFILFLTVSGLSTGIQILIALAVTTAEALALRPLFERLAHDRL